MKEQGKPAPAMLGIFPKLAFVVSVFSLFVLNPAGFPYKTLLGIKTVQAQTMPVQAWVARYNAPDNTADYAQKVTTDPSGNVYVTGQSRSNYLTIKYDAHGNRLWAAEYDSGQVDFPFALSVDASGNVYVTGQSSTNFPIEKSDYVTVKYDSGGRELWAAKYDNGGYDRPAAMSVDASGNVYVTGQSSNGVNYDYATIKYDLNGRQLWVARRATGGNNLASLISVDTSGNVYVTGRDYPYLGYGVYSNYSLIDTVKYDSSGRELWVVQYSNGTSAPSLLSVDASGNVSVTASVLYWSNAAYVSDYVTVRYDPTGNQTSITHYAPDGGNPVSFFMDPSGNVYVVASSNPTLLNEDYVTAKYDSSGTRLWSARYDSGNADRPTALAVDSSGSVFVTGYSFNAALNRDYATIKYNPDGTQLWVQTYDNGGDDSPAALAVDSSGNVYVTGQSFGSGTSYDYATIKYAPANTTPPPCTANCYSNILFLPGIEASRLYDISGNEVWIPNDDSEADYIAMDSSGNSVNQDITTKDAIGETHIKQAYTNIYKSFLAEMKDWESAYHITATTTPYDWRLDYDTVVSTGRKLSNGHISYLVSPQAGHDPYLIETLKQLASTSPSGKVTIIGHSQGGLVAKALMEKLGATTTTQLIDKVIFVATPQLGTPKAVGVLLNGAKAGVPNGISNAKARQLSQNMQSAYNLLPSAPYFTYVDDPVITISSSTLPLWTARYGDSIHWDGGMRSFMSDTDAVRTKPVYDDLNTPEVVDPQKLLRARDVHAALDIWTPPAGVKVTSIAGWGMETLSGVEYRNVRSCASFWKGGCSAYSYNKLTIELNHVIDGDGTVVEPSALWANGASTTRWWVNLADYNNDNKLTTILGLLPFDHKNILEVPTLRTLIQNILTGTSTPLAYISPSAPQYTGTDPRLHFILHSPLTLGFTDTSGNYTGATATSTLLNVPGVRYERIGDVQWLSVPKNLAGTLVLHGISSASFTLDAEEANGNAILRKTSFEGIPSATSTIVMMSIDPSQSVTASSTLLVDEDGDGTVDITLRAQAGGVVTLPPPDTTPPEATLTFVTSTRTLAIMGSGARGTTTVSTTTTSSLVTDEAGNTLLIPFLRSLTKPHRTSLSFNTLVYNGSTTTVATTTLEYKWKTNKQGAYTMFTSYLTTGTTTVKTCYNPKKNETIVITKSPDLTDERDTNNGNDINDDGDDRDNRGDHNDHDTDNGRDERDNRGTRQKFPGMVVPKVVTNKGVAEVVVGTP